MAKRTITIEVEDDEVVVALKRDGDYIQLVCPQPGCLHQLNVPYLGKQLINL